MERLTFAEWLEERDPELYDEINRKWLYPLITAAGLMAGAGGAGARHLHAPSYRGMPPDPSAATQQVTQQTYGGEEESEAPKNAPLKVQLSGRGPFSLHLDHYEIIDSSIDKVDYTIDGKVGYTAKIGVASLVNRNAIMKLAAPGKSGENATMSTGEGGKDIHFQDQEVTIMIHDRTFDITPDLFPEALKPLINNPIHVHISDGWVRLHGTGTITIGGSGDAVSGGSR